MYCVQVKNVFQYQNPIDPLTQLFCWKVTHVMFLFKFDTPKSILHHRPPTPKENCLILYPARVTAETRQFKTQILVIRKIYIFSSNIPRLLPSGIPHLFAQTPLLQQQKGLSEGCFSISGGCFSCHRGRFSFSASNSILKSFLAGSLFHSFASQWECWLKIHAQKVSDKPFVRVEFLACLGQNGSQV